MLRRATIVWIIAGFFLSMIGFFSYLLYQPATRQATESCELPARQENIPSNHGYRVWSGDTLRSFDHDGQAVCIPRGWRAIGVEESIPGWAVFPADTSGVLIREDAFAIQTKRFENTTFEVRIVYPRETLSDEVQQYMM